MSALITQLNTHAGNYERINLFPNSHEENFRWKIAKKSKFFKNLSGNLYFIKSRIFGRKT